MNLRIKMQETYVEELGIVLKNKSKLEKALKIKISNKGKLIFIKGPSEDEYLATKIIEAIDIGFSINRALLLNNENIMLQILNIKELTKRHDLDRVRARIIGTHGKTISNLNHLTDCFISVKDNQVGIIGEIDCIKEAIIALKCLIQGSRQANVYARLERKKKERRLSPHEKIVNELEKEK
jgi:KH domain-containing protein